MISGIALATVVHLLISINSNKLRMRSTVQVLAALPANSTDGGTEGFSDPEIIKHLAENNIDPELSAQFAERF